MLLFFLLFFLPYLSFAEPLIRPFTPFKLTEADEACIARPVLNNFTVVGAWRSGTAWFAILDGCIYEARGVIFGTEEAMAADWTPVAAHEPSDGGGNDSGSGGSGSGAGKVSAEKLLALADSLRKKECDDNPLMICGSFSMYYDPREIMPLSETRFHSEYYLCNMNGSDWRSLYNSTCYLREGFRIEEGKIIPDNDNGNGGDSGDGGNGGNSGDNGNSGSNGDSGNDGGNNGEETGDGWAEKIYHLLNSGLPALGQKIDEFHYSFIVRAETTNDYLASIDSKLGQLTDKDNNYHESQQQFNNTVQGIIDGGIQSYEQEVKNKTGELISQLEKYVPVLNVTHVLPVGFFGSNKDICLPLDFSFTLRPFGGKEIPFSLSTKEACRFYDGYLREVVRFFIYVLTGISLIVLIDKSVSRM